MGAATDTSRASRRAVRGGVLVGLTFLAVVLGWNLPTGLAQEGPGSQPTSLPGGADIAPVVHLLAPAADYAQQYDPLIAEAAVRLAGAELAVRYGIYTKFWPIDQQDQMPPDAYPRLTVTKKELDPAPYAKLTRRGDEFTMQASSDGQRYWLVGRCIVKAPPKMLVGLCAHASKGDGPLEATFEAVTLNGQPLTQGEFIQTGLAAPGGTATHQDGRWTITTVGAKYDTDYRAGNYVLQEVEGDFDLAAKITSPEDEQRLPWGALACRSSLDRWSTYVGMHIAGKDSYAMVMPEGSSFNNGLYDPTGHQIKVTLYTSPEEKEVRSSGRVPVTYTSWEEVTTGTEALADLIERVVAGRLGLDLSAPRAAAPLESEAVERLREVRQQMLTMNSQKILAAIPSLDAVLIDSPTCAQAHRVAAVGGAMLACQHMTGKFHERGRFLAGPLAQVLLARRLQPPAAVEDHLAEAWVALVCGYPKAALENLDRAPGAEAGNPEVRAIRMFATRDYRPLDADAVAQAPPVEQVAWLWAVQECGLDELLETLPGELALAARTPALLPMYTYVGIGPGHAYSQSGMALAFGRNAFDLLTLEDIPLAVRREAGRRMAEALGVQASDDIRQLARNVAWSALEGGLNDEALPETVAPLLDLHAELMKAPVGPEIVGGRAMVRGISLHDFSELQRGLFIDRLYARAFFLGRPLGAPVEGQEFCSWVAKGVAGVPGMAECFRAVGWSYVNDVDQAKAAFAEFAKTALSHRPATIASILLNSPTELRGWGGKQSVLEIPAGRGTWEWDHVAGAANQNGQHHLASAACWMAMNVDDYPSMLHIWTWRMQDTHCVEHYADRMSYNPSFLRPLAGRTRYDDALLKKIYLQLLRDFPDMLSSHSDLAHFYALRGRREEAIALARRAKATCQDSVGLRNFIGSASRLLLEEGQQDEALEWARYSADTGSATGLESLAEVLAATGKIEEARETYWALAQRYATAWQLVRFEIDQGSSAEEIRQAIDTLRRDQPRQEHEVIASARDAFVSLKGHYDLAGEVLSGPPLQTPPAETKRILMKNALRNRDFAIALRYARQLDELAPLDAEDVLMVYIAALLARDETAVQEYKQKLIEHANDPDSELIVQYVQGRLSLEDLRREEFLRSARIRSRLLLGAEAELRGEPQEAIREYGDALTIQIARSFSQRLCDVWLDALTAPPASQPSSQATSAP